jgi:N6-L-threonylcarbamoyladenine synthase
MYTLGIETSCDETAASIVENGKRICSHVVASSLSLHKKFGGIIPEIASRMQLETITGVVECALENAGIAVSKVSHVSVTGGPGLLGSLVTGISFAKGLSLSLGIPLVRVNHLYGHIYSAFFQKKPPVMPFVALVASGGHTSLFYVKDYDEYLLLGSTLDDACGEAFDKVAKIMGLGYPGGPAIEKLSKGADPEKIKFACSNTEQPLDFSFSGIKTAVLYYINKAAKNFGSRAKLPEPLIKDIAASFQHSIIQTLIRKTFLAGTIKRVKTLVVCGGVAANSSLREEFFSAAAKRGYECFFPPAHLSTDNAAMIAGLGFQLYKKGIVSALDAELIGS